MKKEEFYIPELLNDQMHLVYEALGNFLTKAALYNKELIIISKEDFMSAIEQHRDDDNSDMIDMIMVEIAEVPAGRNLKIKFNM